MTTKKRAYMYVDVILTFDMPNADGQTQEFFNLHLPISSKDTNALAFIHNKLFKRIAKKCVTYNRNVNDLVKISTASDWEFYEEKTKAQSLPALGHNCKWYFGVKRTDLDLWEKGLMLEYGFGTSDIWVGYRHTLIDVTKDKTYLSKSKALGLLTLINARTQQL